VTAPTVIGFDGSLTSSGLAVWNDGLWTLDTIRTHPDAPSLEDRWRTITGQLWPRITRHTLVVVEGVFRGLKGGAVLDLAMLHGIIRHGLHTRAVPFAVVNTKHLKQYATGNGNAGKQQMVQAAMDRLHVPVSSHDQADAIWLAAMGLHRYGQPLCPTTAVQAAAAAAARWPQWQLDMTPDYAQEAAP
jgi:Holliday junction resolvasome RuvABC endonuclease subunit